MLQKAIPFVILLLGLFAVTFHHSFDVFRMMDSIQSREIASIPTVTQQAPKAEKQPLDRAEEVTATARTPPPDRSTIEKAAALVPDDSELSSELSSSQEQKQASTAAASPQASQQDERPTIGYFVTVLRCLGRYRTEMFEEAAVLKKSIEVNSYPFLPNASYKAEFNALVWNITYAEDCALELDALGFKVHLKDFPVQQEEIEGDFVRENIGGDGCCGEKELIKLYIYQFTEYPVAVHLDFDTLLLQPLDDLYDAIVTSPNTPEGTKARKAISGYVSPSYKFSTPLQDMIITSYHTRDYAGVRKKDVAHSVGLQGGFLVVKPSLQTFDDIFTRIRKGVFTKGRNETSGWYNSGYGLQIYGVLTIQGFLAYYFAKIDHHHALELHRCIFNQIADNPRLTQKLPDNPKQIPSYRPTPLNATAMGYADAACRDLRENCDDVQCQTFPVSKSKVLHFTGPCRSLPFNCHNKSHQDGSLHSNVCHDMHTEWFKIRHLVEPNSKNANADTHWRRGYCANDFGDYEGDNYMPMNRDKVMKEYLPARDFAQQWKALRPKWPPKRRHGTAYLEKLVKALGEDWW